MKHVYDVQGSTTLNDSPPRILQVHLKSRLPLDADEVREEAGIPSTPKRLSNASNLRASVFSVLIEGESLRGTKKLPARKESFESVASLSSEERSSRSQHNDSFAYWLSFPSAMREALMSSSRLLSFRRRQSVVPNSCLDSLEDLGLTHNTRIRSRSLSRRSSLRRVIARQSGYFETDTLSSFRNGGDVVPWPKGEFTVVPEKMETQPLRQSEYAIHWNEDKEPDSDTFCTPSPPERPLRKIPQVTALRNKRVKKTYSCQDYYHSEEIRILYGDYPNPPPGKKLFSSLFPKCFL